MSYELSKSMRNEINDDIENNYKRVRVNVTIECAIRTRGRHVGLTRNYHKGSGYLFVAFTEECHPGPLCCI